MLDRINVSLLTSTTPCREFLTKFQKPADDAEACGDDAERPPRRPEGQGRLEVLARHLAARGRHRHPRVRARQERVTRSSFYFIFREEEFPGQLRDPLEVKCSVQKDTTGTLTFEASLMSLPTSELGRARVQRTDHLIIMSHRYSSSQVFYTVVHLHGPSSQSNI